MRMVIIFMLSAEIFQEGLSHKGKWNPLFGSVEIAVKFASPKLMILNAEKKKIIKYYPIEFGPKDGFCKL